MKNDDFSSSEEPMDKKEPFNFSQVGRDSAKRSYSHQKKNQEMSSRELSGKSKKNTAIAISVITCLFMGIIGYELVSNTQDKEALKHPLAYTNTSYRHLFVDDTPDEVEENALRLKALKKENKLQASQIKALRQELAIKLQNIHDVKAELFKQEGDPKDKEKITELMQILSDREKQFQDLLFKTKNAENHSADLERKISQLEVTRDALVSIIENHRISKEQEHASLKQQIEALQAAAEADKGSSANKIHLLETAQDHLAESLESKIQQIKELQQELAEKQTNLESQSQALDSLSQNYQEAEAAIKKDIIELVTNLQFEIAAKSIMERKNLKIIADKIEIIESLQQEIAEQHQLAFTQAIQLENLEELSSSHVVNLISSLEIETFLTRKLMAELETVAQQKAQTQQHYASQISALQLEHAQRTGEQWSHHESLSALADWYATANQDLRDQLSMTASSHELETTQTAMLSHKLKALEEKLLNFEEENKILQNFSWQANDSNSTLARHYAQQQLLLADLQLQLEAIATGYQESQEAAIEHTDNLIRALESKNYLLDEAQQELDMLAEQYSETQKHLSNLSWQLEQSSLQLGDLDDSLITAQRQLFNKQNDFERLQIQFEKQSLLLELASQQVIHEEELETFIAALQNQLNTKGLHIEQMQMQLKQQDQLLNEALQQMADEKSLEIYIETLHHQLAVKDANLEQMQLEMEMQNQILNKNIQHQIHEDEFAVYVASLQQQLLIKELAFLEAQQDVDNIKADLEKILSENEMLLLDQQNSKNMAEHYHELLAMLDNNQLELQNFEEQISKLSLQLHHALALQNEKQVALDEHSKALQSLDNLLKDKEFQSIVLQEELKSTLEQLTQYAAENELLQYQNNNHGESQKLLIENATQKHMQLQNMLLQLDEAELAFENAMDQIELHQQMENEFAIYTTSLQQQLADRELEFLKAQNDVEHIKAELEEIQIANENLLMGQQAHDNSNKRYHDLLAIYDHNQSQLQNVEEQMEKLSWQLHQALQLQDEKQIHLNEHAMALQALNLQLKEKELQFDTLQEELESALENVKELVASNELLQHQNYNHEQQQNLLSENAAQKQVELQGMLLRIEDAENGYNNAMSQIELLQQMENEFAIYVTSLQQQLSDKEFDFNKAQNDVENIKAELEEIQIANENLLMSKQAHDTLEKRYHDLLTLYDNNQLQLQNVEEQLDQLSLQMDQAQKLQEEKQIYLDEQVMALQSLDRQFKEKELQFGALQEELGSTLEQLKELVAKNELLQQKNHQHEQEQNLLNETATQKQVEIQSILLRVEDAEKAYTDAMNQIDLQQQKIENLELQLQSAALKNSILKEELNLHKTKLTQQQQEENDLDLDSIFGLDDNDELLNWNLDDEEF